MMFENEWEPPTHSDWQSLLESSPTLITVLDDELNVLRQFGGGIEHPLLHEAGHPFTTDKILIEACQRAQISGTGETVISSLDGFSFRHQIQRQTFTNSTSLVIHSVDISGQSKLDERAHLLETLLDSLPGAVLVYNYETGTTIYANRTIEDITGLKLEDTENHTYIPHFHPDDRDWVENYGHTVLPHLKDGEISSYDARIPHKQHGWVWVHVRDTVLSRFPDGRVKEILGVMIDISDRKVLEEQLQITKRRFDAIMEHASDAIVINRESGDDGLSEPIAINRRVTEQFGLTLEDLQNGRWITSYTPEEFEHSRQRRRSIIEGADPDVVERHQVLEDGIERWAESMAIPIRNAAGDLIESMIFIRDITKRKMLERELRTTKRRFDVLFEKGSDGIAISAYVNNNPEDAKLLTINQRVSDIVGYTFEELQEHGWLMVYPPEEVAKMRNRIIQSDSTMPMGLAERRFIHKNGQEGWIESMMNVIRDEDGNRIEAIAMVRDITERKRLEADRLTALNQFRSLAENIPQWIVRVSHDMRYTYLNPAVAETLDIDVEDLVTRYLAHAPVLKPNLMARWQDLMKESARKRALQRVEFSLDLTGEPIIVQMIIVPEYGDNGDLIGWLNVANDITDLRQRETELREARQQAEAALHIRDRFLASVSHELRTPLNAILGFSDVLLMRADMTPEETTHVELIHSSGIYLKRLIDDVLQVSQMSLGRFELREGAVDLHHLLEQVVQTFQPTAERRGIQLIAEVSPDLPQTIVADGIRLQQIIGNLLDNALKFTDEGPVELRASVGAGWILLVVADTGAGLSESIRARMFEAFASESLEKEESSGLGLGLYIVKSLVTLMEGTITADNHPEGGAIFRVALPLKKPDANAPDTSETRPVQQPDFTARGIRAVIVDDVAANAALFDLWLTRWGFETRTLYSSTDIIEHLNTWQPQVIIVDLYMPDVDGFTLAQMIRAHPHGENIALIAATASIVDEDYDRAQQAGFDAVLSKPVLQTELAQILERMLATSFAYPEMESHEAVHGTTAPDGTILEGLTALEVDWLRQMYVASGAALSDEALSLVNAIEADDTALAASLRERIGSYRITEIADLIEPLLTDE